MTQTFNFEAAMERLNVIAQELEKDDVPLEIAIALFEEGLNLSKKCQVQLNTYEAKVKDLVEKHQGEKND